MHESGIYYFKKSGSGAEVIALEPTVYSQSKSGEALASALSYEIAKVKVGVTLDGVSSHMQIQEQKPEFYFYFDVTMQLFFVFSQSCQLPNSIFILLS